MIINVQNVDKNQPKRANITNSIREEVRFRNIENIQTWQNAIDRALSVYNPDYQYLMDVYYTIFNDGHLSGVIEAIKNEVKAKSYSINNSSDKVDDDKTKLFQKKWYFQTVDAVIDSLFYGYSLIQFGPIKDDIFEYAKAIERKSIVPCKRIVKKRLTDTSESTDVIRFDDPPHSNWSIFVSEIPEKLVNQTQLGLYNKCAPHALAKKELFQAAWEYAEVYGMPLAVGKTDLEDTARRKNMEDTLSNMGRRQWLAIDAEAGDDLVLEDANKTDAWQVYLEPLRESNNEISKILAGQVGMFDAKGFVGSVEAQERLFSAFVTMYCRLVAFVMNDQVMPLLNFHNLGFQGMSFKFIVEEKISLLEKSNIIRNISGSHKLTKEQFEEFMGLEVEEIEEAVKEVVKEKEVQSIMPSVKNLYKDFYNTETHE